MRNLTNFYRLKNSHFILESIMVELNQNKNSILLDRQDTVRKLYFTLEINFALLTAGFCCFFFFLTSPAIYPQIYQRERERAMSCSDYL